MRIRVVTALSAVMMLCGCASNGGLESALPTTGSARGNYQVLAACVTQKLDEPGLAKIDLPSENTSKVSLSSGGVRYWEVVFTGEGQERTIWSISVVNTMWGPFPRVGEKAERAIRECEAETPPVATAMVAAPVGPHPVSFRLSHQLVSITFDVADADREVGPVIASQTGNAPAGGDNMSRITSR